MKKNNKGFILAETVVTVSIIATLATSIYIYVSKISNRFEERGNYEKIVDVYKLNTIGRFLNDTGYLIKSNESAYDISSNTSVISETLKNELKINRLYFVNAKNGGKDSINASDLKSLRDYLDYIVIDDTQISDDEYRLIGMFKESDNSIPTFANIVINISE